MKKIQPTAHPGQTGFTLLELMVAMAVTLVITGAMFAMVTSAQTSFRREPALADRQMQIRIAMDRIQEDLLNAGTNLGPFGQAFVENRNGIGPLGVRPLGSPTFGGGNSDVIEMRMQTPDCPTLRVRSPFPGPPAANQAGPNYTLGADEITALGDANFPCYTRPGFVLATFLNGGAKFGWRDRATAPLAVNLIATADAASQLASALERQCPDRLVAGACPTTTLPSAAPISEPGWRIAAFGALDQVRYQIGVDVDGVPALFRSARGGLNDAGVREAPLVTRNQWQLIARGVEDLQIRYRTGPPDNNGVLPAFIDNAPTVVAGNFSNIVRQVEITLWARALEGNLQGQNTYTNLGLRADLVQAVRGSLTTVVAPRAVEVALSTAPAGDTNRWQ